MFPVRERNRANKDAASTGAGAASSTADNGVFSLRTLERRGAAERCVGCREHQIAPHLEDAHAAFRPGRGRQRFLGILRERRDEFEGLSFREVATATGVSEGTAKSRLRLALARLRRAVEE